MRKIILSQEGCTKCKMLKEQLPDAEMLIAKPEAQQIILALARALDIRSLPIVVLTGDVSELAEALK